MNLKAIISMATPFVLLALALLQINGLIDLPGMFVDTIKEIDEIVTDPGQMKLQVLGTNQEENTKFFDLIYDGYKVSSVVLNSGSAGHATIRCEAYDTSGQMYYYLDQYPHFERNEQKTLVFILKDIPKEDYKFKVKIINQATDS